MALPSQCVPVYPPYMPPMRTSDGAVAAHFNRERGLSHACPADQRNHARLWALCEQAEQAMGVHFASDNFSRSAGRGHVVEHGGGPCDGAARGGATGRKQSRVVVPPFPEQAKRGGAAVVRILGGRQKDAPPVGRGVRRRILRDIGGEASVGNLEALPDALPAEERQVELIAEVGRVVVPHAAVGTHHVRHASRDEGLPAPVAVARQHARQEGGLVLVSRREEVRQDRVVDSVRGAVRRVVFEEQGSIGRAVAPKMEDGAAAHGQEGPEGADRGCERLEEEPVPVGTAMYFPCSLLEAPELGGRVQQANGSHRRGRRKVARGVAGPGHGVAEGVRGDLGKTHEAVAEGGGVEVHQPNVLLFQGPGEGDGRGHY
mmetsp:Transcript_1770/g.2693  ORF Transcript_1770/g.2693 Transcript_1770/m.2693 type:complete len:373 (-) Transcript_1770:65-1183(-)